MPGTQKSTLDQFKGQKKVGSHPAYQEYKQTDHKCFEKIPQEWETYKLKQISGVFPSNVDKKEKEGEPSIRLCNYTEVYNNSEITADMDFMQATAKKSEIQKFRLEKGDVIITKDSESWDDIGVPSYVAQTMDDVICGYHLAHLKPYRSTIDGKYLYYFLESEAGSYHFHIEANGVTRYGISTNGIKEAPVTVPPKGEQEAIVEFLDNETEKIDHLIEKKTKLIDLIEEKRTAMITDAVTQGLDSDVGTKSSGVPGLGEIPEDWDLAPLKYSSRNITVGIVSKPSQYYVDDGVPALRSLNIKENKIVENEFVYISEEANKELKGSQLHTGDLVSVRSGDPGTTAVVPEELDGANCIDLIIIRKPDGYIPEFLSFLMNSEASTSQIEAGTEGAAQQHFNVGEVKELVFPKPDLDEQKEILNWLSPRLKGMDETEAKIREGIERLKEYRTTLITEAVTGQIDVRGEV